MSYLHCPSCGRAYHLGLHPACPSCGVRAGAPADVVADVIAAAEQLARAMSRATPAELASAERTCAANRSLPVVAASSAIAAGDILRAVRAPESASVVLAPPRERAAHAALLATVALALSARLVTATQRTLAARAGGWSARARAVLARVRG